MYLWLSNLLWGPGTALRQEQIRGSLEAVFLTPTSRLVALFAPPISHLPFSLLNFVTMGLTLWLVFGIVLPLGPVLEAMVVIAIGIPSMYAIGSLFAASVLRFGETGPIFQLVRGTFVLACGIPFPHVAQRGFGGPSSRPFTPPSPPSAPRPRPRSAGGPSGSPLRAAPPTSPASSSSAASSAG